MKYRSIPGFEGLVYQPDCQEPCKKKHDCQDCFNCQMCGDERCEICIDKKMRRLKTKKTG
jgi:hypothetical protein